MVSERKRAWQVGAVPIVGSKEFEEPLGHLLVCDLRQVTYISVSSTAKGDNGPWECWQVNSLAQGLAVVSLDKINVTFQV